MKKKILKAIAMCLALVTVVSCLVVSSSAGIVPGRFYNTDVKTTAVTGTRGYISGNYTGEYYADGSGVNTAVMRGECQGGPVSSFTTTLTTKLWDGVNHNYHNPQVSTTSRYLEDVRTVSSDTLGHGAIGSVYATTKSNTQSSDKWEYGYECYWLSAREGWSRTR